MEKPFTWMQMVLYTTLGTAVVLVVGLGLLIMNFVQMRNELVEWPPLTMYYSQEIHEGHSRILSRMRLSHNSPENWTQEVIKGRVYETRWGTFDETGSYISLEGRTFSSYDATTGDYETETVPEGTRMAPRGGLWPVQVSVFHRLFGKRPEAVTTQSRVCFRGDCTDNAPGWKYAVGRQTFIIADDARGIPIQRNNFVIDEILVHADQEPLNP